MKKVAFILLAILFTSQTTTYAVKQPTQQLALCEGIRNVIRDLTEKSAFNSTKGALREDLSYKKIYNSNVQFVGFKDSWIERTGKEKDWIGHDFYAEYTISSSDLAKSNNDVEVLAKEIQSCLSVVPQASTFQYNGTKSFSFTVNGLYEVSVKVDKQINPKLDTYRIILKIGLGEDE